MTTAAMEIESMLSNKIKPQHVPVGVQIVSLVLYTGFAIPVSIVAMDAFWPAGIALAGFLAWQWGRLPTLNGGTPVNEAVDALRPQVSEPAIPSSGNTSFDAYRADLLDRLEKEQVSFEQFLVRLRDARGKSEFDQFMEDRAVAAAKTIDG